MRYSIPLEWCPDECSNADFETAHWHHKMQHTLISDDHSCVIRVNERLDQGPRYARDTLTEIVRSYHYVYWGGRMWIRNT